MAAILVRVVLSSIQKRTIKWAEMLQTFYLERISDASGPNFVNQKQYRSYMAKDVHLLCIFTLRSQQGD